MLLHCISCESLDPVSDYQIIRKEIEGYSSKLAKCQEIVVLTKADLIDQKIVLDNLKKKFKTKLAVSITDDVSLKQLSDTIHQLLG